MPRIPKKPPVKKRGLGKTYRLRSSLTRGVTYEYGKRTVKNPSIIIKAKKTITRPRKSGKERRQIRDSVKRALNNSFTFTGTANELFDNRGIDRRKKGKRPKKKK